jgi:hypothetical protein
MTPFPRRAARPRSVHSQVAQVALAVAFGVLAASARAGGAGDDDRPPAPPPAHRPPPEALAACQQHASGDACRFDGPRGAHEGRCWAPQGKPLACRPEDAPPPQGDRHASAPKAN